MNAPDPHEELLDEITVILGDAFDPDADWEPRTDSRGYVMWRARSPQRPGELWFMHTRSDGLVCAVVSAATVTFIRLERIEDQLHPVATTLGETPRADPRLN